MLSARTTPVSSRRNTVAYGVGGLPSGGSHLLQRGSGSLARVTPLFLSTRVMIEVYRFLAEMVSE